jgi:hypothetical protein
MSDVREEHALVIKRIDLGVRRGEFPRERRVQAPQSRGGGAAHRGGGRPDRCHPSNVDQNIALRLEIAKLETWREWIVGLYEDGQAARELLNQLEAETGGQEPPQ